MKGHTLLLHFRRSIQINLSSKAGRQNGLMKNSTAVLSPRLPDAKPALPRGRGQPVNGLSATAFDRLLSRRTHRRLSQSQARDFCDVSKTIAAIRGRQSRRPRLRTWPINPYLFMAIPEKTFWVFSPNSQYKLSTLAYRQTAIINIKNHGVGNFC
jgi:hypothetical protein